MSRLCLNTLILAFSITLSGCFLDSKITNLNEPISGSSKNPVLTGEPGSSKDFIGTSQFKVTSQTRGYTANGFLGATTQKVSAKSPRGYTLEYSVEVLSQ